jgi:prolycopene isomerase
MGGISAAAFLAKAGKKVLLLERLDGPGGYAHSFRRGPYLFDPAVHAIGQFGPGGYLDTWLRLLGVRDRCTMIPLDPFYTVVFPGFEMNAPFGVEEFIEAHVERFPHEEAGIRSFMGLCRRIKTEWDQARPTALGEDDDRGFETVLQYRMSTLAEVMEEHLRDPKLKAVISAIWGYQGAPPSRLSFITYAGMTVSLLEGRQNYCQGSFQNLVNAFVYAMEECGGELVVKQPAARILVEEGRATGVELRDGRRIHADIVVSNADARQTLEQLVGRERLPEQYLRRLERMSVSTSAFLVYAAARMDLEQFDVAHEIFKFRHWDHDRNYEGMLAGEVTTTAITAPSLADPSLAPEGEHIITAVTFAPYQADRPWPELKDRYVDAILGEIDEIFPGARDRLTFVEGATPEALHRYSLNHQGAVYGWENIPRQSHSKRLSNKTPIEGLWLASAWAQPGSGTVNALYSGFQAARSIMGFEDGDAFLRSLDAENPVTTADRAA